LQLLATNAGAIAESVPSPQNPGNRHVLRRNIIRNDIFPQPR
jgi:hypothetical protein